MNLTGIKKPHTDREYEGQLRDLRERLLRMAGLVEQMIHDSMRVLVQQDAELARQVIETDHRVNRLEVETDELCLLVLAKRQPMASDLRFITLTLKMVTDLERVGDLAVNICERAIDLGSSTPVVPWDDLVTMGDTVQSMVHDAIDAFVERDAQKAQEIHHRDDVVDELYSSVFAMVLEVMREDPTTIQRGIHVQSVAKWLERMGDHATNLAEQVVFMIKGKDIRHLGKLDD